MYSVMLTIHNAICSWKGYDEIMLWIYLEGGRLSGVRSSIAIWYDTSVFYHLYGKQIIYCYTERVLSPLCRNTLDMSIL